MNEHANGHAPDLLADEGALIAALKARAAAPVDVARVDVPGMPGLSFRVRALSLEELAELRGTHSKWVKAEDGTQVQAIKNDAVFGADLVLAATVPEDRERLWGNPKLREALGVGLQRDMVLALFPRADQMAAVVEQVAGGIGAARDAAYKSGD